MDDYKLEKDHQETPKPIVEEFFDFVELENKRLWFPFDKKDSEFVQVAKERNYDYEFSHLYDLEQRDYFEYSPEGVIDFMVSNPPFSIQNDILKRSFELYEARKIKSFALLLPISTLETIARGDIYEEYSDVLSVVILKRRIKFKGHTSSFNTGCCWVCVNCMKTGLYWLEGAR